MGEQRLKDQKPPPPPPAAEPSRPPVDPARVTEVNSADNSFELVLLMRRIGFVFDSAGFTPQMIPVAAVSLGWPVAKQMRDLLVHAVDRHEEKYGPIHELPTPQWKLDYEAAAAAKGKPN
jgi:hypothetical protein